MLCRYNVVNFLKNIHKRHPITHPLGRGMGCLLWIHHLFDILPEFLQSFTQYLTILDCIITALDCNIGFTMVHELKARVKHTSFLDLTKLTVITSPHCSHVNHPLPILPPDHHPLHPFFKPINIDGHSSCPMQWQSISWLTYANSLVGYDVQNTKEKVLYI